MKMISRIVVPLLLPAAFFVYLSHLRCSPTMGEFTSPDSVTVIEAEAFTDNTSITSVTIPEIITMIGERAFYGCINLKDVFISVQRKMG